MYAFRSAYAIIKLSSFFKDMTEPGGGEQEAPPEAAEGGGEQEAPRPVERTPQVSAESIVPADSITNRDQARIQVVGDETVVLNREATALEIYNQRGERIPRTGLDLMIADWTQVAPRGDGRPWLLVATEDDIPDNTPNAQTLDTLPPALRSAGEALLGGDPIATIPTEVWRIDPTNPNVSIDADEDVVMIYEAGTDNFIAFVRRDNNGNPLTGDNWVRVDSVNSDIDNFIDGIRYNLEYRSEVAERPGVLSVSVLDNDDRIFVSSNRLVVKKPDGDEHSETVIGVGNNVAIDPRNPHRFLYCSADADQIFSIDTSEDPMVARAESLTQNYPGVRNLQLDSSGYFLTFASEGNFVILNSQTLEEVDSIEGIFHGALVEDRDPNRPASIQGLNAEGHTVTYSADFTELRRYMHEQELARSRGAFGADEAARRVQEEQDAQFAHLRGERDNLVQVVESRMPGLTSLDNFAAERGNVEAFLQSNPGLTPEDRAYLTAAAERVIVAREREIATTVVNNHMESLRELIQGGMSVEEHDEAGRRITALRDLAARTGLIVDDELRAQIVAQDEAYVRADTAYKKERFSGVQQNARDIVTETRAMLDRLTTTSALKNWRDEGNISALRMRLRELEIELQNSDGTIDSTVHAVIVDAQRDLGRMVSEHQKVLEKRESVAETSPTAALMKEVQLIKQEIDELMEGLQGLEDRDDIYGSTAYSEMLQRVEDFRTVDVMHANDLRRVLGIKVALFVAAREREAFAGKDDAGRPRVLLGSDEESGEFFPIWEYPDEDDESQNYRRVTLDFKQDTHRMEKGKAVAYGDIMVNIDTKKHDKQEYVTRRLFEGLQYEDMWRNSIYDYRDVEVPGTYVSAPEFKQIKKKHMAWERGTLKAENDKYIQEIKDVYEDRLVRLADGREMRLGDARTEIVSLRAAGNLQMIEVPNAKGETNRRPFVVVTADENADVASWEERYKELQGAYGEFANENYILFFTRLDRIKREEEVEETNGYGYVPDWNPGWTEDEQVNHMLGKIGKSLKMQIEDKQGLTMLEGDAGTGKDVLVRMIANKLNRKLFTFDASRWTTEKHLTQDVTLQDGSVVAIPSIILKGIQTPGAIVYINEFNAMPEQSQIALHALFDQKRAMTLKGEGGKEVKADPDVLFMGSMNPDYAGTYAPQEATKSRMDIIRVDYTPYYKGVDSTGRPDPNSGINSAEGLRMARSVTSLADFTYDLNLDHNTFVQLWENRFNGASNPNVPALTADQKYDMDTIKAVVKFTAQLRDAFRLRLNPDRPTNAFTIRQPVTGREIAACAFDLRHLTQAERGASPVDTAKRLLIRHVVSKISGKYQKEILDATAAINSWA